MKDQWELCYVRPRVSSGAEVIFFHPRQEMNKQYRNKKDFLKSRQLEVRFSDDELMLTISTLLSDGWEPLSVGGGVGMWSGTHPDFGATGYAFRKRYYA